MARTVGEAARKLHQPIIDLVSGRRIIEHEELKMAAAGMSGRGGSAGNALASVAIDQLERWGKIERSKSGRSWRIRSGPAAHRPSGRPTVGRMMQVRMPEVLIDALDAEARSAGITRADVVRALLARALAR